MKSNAWVVMMNRTYGSGGVKTSLYEFPTRKDARNVKNGLKRASKNGEKVRIFHKIECHVGMNISYFLTPKG